MDIEVIKTGYYIDYYHRVDGSAVQWFSGKVRYLSYWIDDVEIGLCRNDFIEFITFDSQYDEELLETLFSRACPQYKGR